MVSGRNAATVDAGRARRRSSDLACALAGGRRDWGEMSEIEIKLLRGGDREVLNSVAEEVFDHEVLPALAAEFLDDTRHHLAVAICDREVIGFASGVHYVHPDKPAELWINEIGVAPPFRRRGIGQQLMEALFEAGRDCGCAEAWVLAESGNSEARRFYAALDGKETPSVMYSFALQKAERP